MNDGYKPEGCEKPQRMDNPMTAKFVNRRVTIGRLSESDEIGVIYKNLIGWRDIRVTKFKLSAEAAEATMVMIHTILTAPRR